MPAKSLFGYIQGAGAVATMLLTPHHAAQFVGGASLQRSGGSWAFPHGPKNFTVSYWLRVDALPTPAQLGAKVFDIGGSAGPNVDVLGMDLTPSGHLRSFGSNGATYSVCDPAFLPVLGRWYYIIAEFGGSALQFQAYDQTTGSVAGGGSAGMTGPYNAPAAAPIGIALSPDGLYPCSCALDSFAIWNDVNAGSDFNNFFYGNNPSVPEMFRQTGGNRGVTLGQAEEYSVAGGFADAPPVGVRQLYLDFNEQSNSTLYNDSSPNARAFTASIPNGAAINQIAGAGY